MNYVLNFAAVWRSLDKLLWGLGLSLVLAVAAILIGCVIGLACALALRSRSGVIRRVVRLYVTIIRNTPILVLILFAYFAMPEIGIRLDKISAFIATLALYSGAYLAEIFRAGLISVPGGLREAGLAIGLTEMQVRTSIVLPLMLRNVLPSLGSTFISLFKDTSLAAAIAIPELTFEARKINVESFRVIETWIVASALYVCVSTVLAGLLRQLERKLTIPR